ncbi:MAG TPA: hypothetical protein VJS85_01905 [Rhizomicrobium sp.]|nr:hypothetical protein [Rhizomicrobium sp.]
MKFSRPTVFPAPANKTGMWPGAATEDRLRKARNSGVLPGVAVLPDMIKRELPLPALPLTDRRKFS